MADVQGLYIVTGVVVAALFAWVVVVLVRAPKAIDLSKLAAPPPPAPEAAKSPEVVESAADLSATPPPTVTSAEPEAAPPIRDEPPPAAHAAGQPARTMLGLAAPAPIAMPAPAPASSRSYLDSHPEIQDSPASPTVIVMPESAGGTGGDPLVLATAVGVADPLPGKSPERHAIFDKHHLFVFADGGGKRAGEDLASAIVVDAVGEAFETDETTGFVDDPKLSLPANRVRRAVLSANRRLLRRARESGYAGMGTSVLAAYFSPDHRELFVGHVGASRAYCVRDGHLTRLTTPHGARTLGVVERVDVEVVQEAVRPQDLYLFCSDALGRAFSESELLASVDAEPSLGALTLRLVEEARGKDDAPNLVAIAVRLDLAEPSSEKHRDRAKTVLGLG
jgi:protein phosphatase